MKVLICIILIGAFLISSCNDKTKNQKIIKDTIIYKSAPNGDAEIKLKIKDNGKILLYIKFLPSPNSKDKLLIKRYRGRWSGSDCWIKLNFQQWKEVIPLLFIDNHKYKNEFNLNSVDNYVRINSCSLTIHIWGIRCEKTQ